ncbi:MAG TPA: glycoside hydrolase family 28 protein [Terriglobia bacterium]|nr:glycoside hydrolase family 28 protein [Terriglobia bacterium]
MPAFDLSRREFMKLAAALPLARPIQSPDPWDEMKAILGRVREPVFPARDFDAARYPSINDAIEACSQAGGGRVVVPAGSQTIPPIRLRSRVNLHLPEGAVLRFTTDPKAYLPVVFTRWEGTELMNYSPFVYAFDQENIAITGSGTLDGQAGAAQWWNWTRQAGAARTRLMSMGASGVPVAERVFGEGSFLRPNFIQPYRCRNVFIDGVTIVNSPMWEIHPVLCSNVIVRGVSIVSHGPNNDGCNPESCRDVLIEKCSFDTGDDCIALKSGRNNDGRRVGAPVENVIVRDCVMKDGHGGVTIGSEISGGARNIFAERCRMDSPQLDRALRIKTNSVRGGVIERVFLRDITIGQVREAVVAIDFNYEEGDAGQYPPVVRDIDVRNTTSQKSNYGLLLRGYPHSPITNVRLSDCRFDGVARADVLDNVKDVALANVVINGKVFNETITR